MKLFNRIFLLLGVFLQQVFLKYSKVAKSFPDVPKIYSSEKAANLVKDLGKILLTEYDLKDDGITEKGIIIKTCIYDKLTIEKNLNLLRTFYENTANDYRKQKFDKLHFKVLIDNFMFDRVSLTIHKNLSGNNLKILFANMLQNKHSITADKSNILCKEKIGLNPEYDHKSVLKVLHDYFSADRNKRKLNDQDKNYKISQNKYFIPSMYNQHRSKSYLRHNSGKLNTLSKILIQ